MTKEMRMDAYYYGFDRTGEDCVDLILSAVACAGKAFHETDQWTDQAAPNRYNERLRGATMVDGIQNAAADAAKEIASLRTRLSAAEAERDQARADAEAARQRDIAHFGDCVKVHRSTIGKCILCERDEAVKVAVWVAQKANIERIGGRVLINDVCGASTPEGIYRALRKAKEASGAKD